MANKFQSNSSMHHYECIALCKERPILCQISSLMCSKIQRRQEVAKLVAALLRVVGVTAGLAESNGSLLLGLWLKSPAGWLPRTGISSRTLCSVIEYGQPLPSTLAVCVPRSSEDKSPWMFLIQVVRGCSSGHLQFSGGGSTISPELTCVPRDRHADRQTDRQTTLHPDICSKKQAMWAKYKHSLWTQK